jgi:isopentenyldiphosphate isomerase
LFAVLDANGEPTGASKRRADIHRDGDWHGALHIWVGGVEAAGRSFALFQRRSASKDTWPGSLDVAVGGHLRAGESLAETVREAEEEIGLILTLADLTRLGRRFAHSVGGRDNEVQEVFGLRSDLRLDRYRLHPDEVSAVVSVGLDDAIALFEGVVETVPALELRRDPASAVPAAIDVGVSDFAAGEVGGYAARALRGLRAVVAGGAPEPFELR